MSEVDDLDQFLDTRQWAALNGSATSLTLAADRFHALETSDATSDPHPAFVVSLQRELLGSKAALSTTESPRRSKTRVAPMSVSGLRAAHVSWIAFVALLAVTSVLVYAAFLDHDVRDRAKTPNFAANDVVKPLAYETVELAECKTTARPAGTVKSLIGQTPSRTPVLPKGTEQLPSGIPTVTSGPITTIDPVAFMAPLPKADESTLAGVTATVRQLTACRIYHEEPKSLATGDLTLAVDGRFYALFGDDFFRNTAFVAQSSDGRELIIANAIAPRGPAPWRVDDLRALPDGRAIALISPTQPNGSPFASMLLVLSLAGDRWLIDEQTQVVPQHSNFTGPDALQTMEIALRDDQSAVTLSSPSSNATFYSRPITVTVANLGDRPQEFRIGSLDVSIVIEPGQSISFEITAPPGLYVMESYVTSSLNPEEQLLRLERVLRIVDAGTPIGLG
jgi:hypothetical protein